MILEICDEKIDRFCGQYLHRILGSGWLYWWFELSNTNCICFPSDWTDRHDAGGEPWPHQHGEAAAGERRCGQRTGRRRLDGADVCVWTRPQRHRQTAARPPRVWRHPHRQCESVDITFFILITWADRFVVTPRSPTTWVFVDVTFFILITWADRFVVTPPSPTTWVFGDVTFFILITWADRFVVTPPSPTTWVFVDITFFILITWADRFVVTPRSPTMWVCRRHFLYTYNMSRSVCCDATLTDNVSVCRHHFLYTYNMSRSVCCDATLTDNVSVCRHHFLYTYNMSRSVCCDATLTDNVSLSTSLSLYL